MVPSSTVTPLQGLQSAAGTGTNVSYTQGLPTDTAADGDPVGRSVAGVSRRGTGFGGSYTGTLTAPETGTYVLAITNPCGCYTPEYLSLDGTQLIANPGTPPVNTYSVAVNLTAGQQYTLSISGGGESSAT